MMTMMIIQGVLPRHLNGVEHRQQRLAKSGRTHAGNQYHCYHRHCDHHITLQVQHKTTNISCQKYAVPYTETSPRRVTRKAVANSNIVLASDPDDLQRLTSLLRFYFPMSTKITLNTETAMLSFQRLCHLCNSYYFVNFIAFCIRFDTFFHHYQGSIVLTLSIFIAL